MDRKRRAALAVGLALLGTTGAGLGQVALAPRLAPAVEARSLGGLTCRGNSQTFVVDYVPHADGVPAGEVVAAARRFLPGQRDNPRATVQRSGPALVVGFRATDGRLVARARCARLPNGRYLVEHGSECA